MVARDASDLNDNDNVSEGIVTNGESLSARIYNNAEIEIPECRKQLLDVKESMFNTADMYQQDYLDKVEERSDLTHEAKEKAVMCLLDVSEKIYNLAGRFQRLIEDQADKLQEIENLTLTASTSLEVASCQNFRTDLVNRVPVSNMPQRQPRIGRPETMQTEFYAENVIWEKLNYNKLDSIGSGGIGPLESDDEHYASILSQSTSQVSLTSVGSSRSHVAPSAASSSLHSPVLQDSRLTASSIDVSRDPTSPALNRCNSSSSLTSTKSEVVTSAHHHRKPTKNNPALVKRSLSSLRLMPSRAAPAPPPSKSKQHRPRVYSVKNETGEGLEKPAIPAPRPPAAGEDEHYAIPPSRMPTVSEEDKECRTTPVPEVIYDQARSGPPPPAPPPPSQYQQIVIESPFPDPDYNDDDLYADLDEIYDAPPARPHGNAAFSPLPVSSPTSLDPLSPGGLFGPPKSPISLSYNSYKRQTSAIPIVSVIPPPSIDEDSEGSEFADPAHLEEMYADVTMLGDVTMVGDVTMGTETGEYLGSEPKTPVPGQGMYVEPEYIDDDIYSDVDNVYDAPSLRTPTNNMYCRTDPVSFPAPLAQDPDDDAVYIDNEVLPPPAAAGEVLPPPPADILPPPPPAPDTADDIYIDTDMVQTTVSDSKDSGFYADGDDEDAVIDTVHAIYPYAATATDELTLAIGDVVKVHVKNADGWYEGTLNGERGLFPGNYVLHVD